MLFNELILTNIGAYHSNQAFNFKTDQDRNIILVGGKNGAGKTTLLDSIRLCLFGPFAFGYKTENDMYLKKITSMLNIDALRKHESMFQITLDFSIVEDYEKHNYRIRRSWNLSSGKPRESVQVLKDQGSSYLTAAKTELFLAKLHTELPPRLFEFCLFDGEEISRVISDDTLPQYLKVIANVIFNLDLFQNLDMDLNQLFRQAAQGDLSADEKSLQESKDKLSMLLEGKEQLINRRANLSIESENVQSNLQLLKKDFETNGGLIKNKRDQLLAQMHDIEFTRQNNQEKIKKFIATLLPFYLTKDLLKDTQIQMNNEQANDIYSYIAQTLKPGDFQHVLKNLRQDLKATSSTTELEQTLYRSILNLLQPQNQHVIHRASLQQRTEIGALRKQIEAINVQEVLKIFDENSQKLKELYEIRKQVEHNDQTSEFGEFILKIEQQTKMLEKQNYELNLIDEKLAKIDQQIVLEEKDVAGFKAKVLKHNKAENIFRISTAIIEISQKFQAVQLQKKMNQVEQFTLRILNQVFRKDHYFSALRIDPITFELTLLDGQKQKVNNTKLSAGEKQILLLSIIAAMVKCSYRRLPFVFDTLLGRLDKTHRLTVLQKLIPSMSEQVIILSTDSEIDQELFPCIQPFMARCYTLEYLDAERRINVENKYFDLKSAEAVS